EVLGLPSVVLINDFSAVASGLHLLRPADLKTLQAGQPAADGPLALLGAGTGLGTAFVLQDSVPPRVLPSEAGHMSFAPSSPTEDALLAFLRDEFGHVSYERVLSGAGLVNVYRFLVASGFAPENPAVSQEMGTEDPAAVITRHAGAGTDPNCRRAVEMFVSVYGAHAGNLALALLATGGVFIAGGIAPRIVAQLAAGSFIKAFLAKGRLADFISAIPVHVITNPDVGLLGAAAVGARSARAG
ncbi:MAG TPA: glucokinase, partial [Gemmatimonadales bacterium]|nr:glucokinase [Gemmatimonadales bacterium]